MDNPVTRQIPKGQLEDWRDTLLRGSKPMVCYNMDHNIMTDEALRCSKEACKDVLCDINSILGR